MTSHTSLRSIGSLTLAIVAGALIAGCGAGRQTQAFVPAEPTAAPAEVAATAVPAPPVFGAQEGAQAPATVTGGAQVDPDRIAAQRAEHRRKLAQRKLRHERNAAERAHKRAAVREKALRKQLAAAKAKANATPQPVRQAPEPVDPSITASDVPVNTTAQHNTEARAAALRFHELLNDRNAEACSLMTTKLLQEIYGKEPGAMERCWSTVQSVNVPISFVIDASSAKGSRASVHGISKLGDAEIHQTLHLLLVSGTWLLDRAERDPAS